MSRYEIPPHSGAAVKVIIGWDNPLQTFFATVHKSEGKRSTELLWVGGTPSECLCIKALADHLAPWASIPIGTARQLEAERDQAPPPTRLQALALTHLRGAGGAES